MTGSLVVCPTSNVSKKCLFLVVEMEDDYYELHCMDLYVTQIYSQWLVIYEYLQDLQQLVHGLQPAIAAMTAHLVH